MESGIFCLEKNCRSTDCFKYKYKASFFVAKVKAKELNVEEVLYMNVQKNKYAYIVKDGARGIMLYSDERSLYTKLYKGLKMTPLQP